jgi:hypothetical protein
MRPVAKAVWISYTLAGRRLPRGMNSYDASLVLRTIAQGDASSAMRRGPCTAGRSAPLVWRSNRSGNRLAQAVLVETETGDTLPRWPESLAGGVVPVQTSVRTVSLTR